MTAFVLAGGLGTRIAGLHPELPKAMIPVGGRPFIDVLLDQLAGYDVVVCAGHHADPLVAHARERGVRAVVEPRPLGTAGALAFARQAVKPEPGTFLALNGDTYAEVDLKALLALHARLDADATLACYRVDDAAARGTVEPGEGGRLAGFREKAHTGPGWVSGGVYALEPRALDGVPADQASGLETEVFPRLLARGRTLGALRVQGSFWDMGTPEGLAAAVSKFAGGKA